MRTDLVNLSTVALEMAREYIPWCYRNIYRPLPDSIKSKSKMPCGSVQANQTNRFKNSAPNGDNSQIRDHKRLYEFNFFLKKNGGGVSATMMA